MIRIRSPRKQVSLSLLVLLVVAAALLGVAVVRGGPPLALSGIERGIQLLVGVLPHLVIGFALAGLITVLLPRDALAPLVGHDSGYRGLAIATLAGAATPGGPFVQFPLVAAIAAAGAGPGPMAAYITAWSLLGWNRIVVYEVPLLGPSFAAARIVASLVIPFAVGILTSLILRLLSRDGMPLP